MIADRELNRAIRAYQQGDGATLHLLRCEIRDALRELRALREHARQENWRRCVGCEGYGIDVFYETCLLCGEGRMTARAARAHEEIVGK